MAKILNTKNLQKPSGSALTQLGAKSSGSYKRKASQILGVVTAFSLGQISVQLLTGITGICLVRWLSISEYAQFGFSLTFQSALGLMVDLGVTGAVIALVGENYRDKAALGKFMSGGLSLRTRFLLVSSVVGSGAFVYLASRQGWPVARQVMVFLVIALGLLAQFWSAMFGVPLILHRRLGIYYGVQVGVAALRLATISSLYAIHSLGSATSLASGSVAAFFGALVFKKVSKTYWTAPAYVSREIRRKLLRYVAPVMPIIIFMSIQGQVTVLIMSYFGSARPIAEVAALGRLGQIFALLAAFNGIVLGPHFARLHLNQLKCYYFRVTAASCAFAGAASCAVCLWPNLLLSLLGSKYTSLVHPLRYVALTGSVNYIVNVLWSIHSARQWIYWWYTWLFIGGVTATQLLGISILKVNTTLGASQLGLLTAVTILAAEVSVGVYSLNRKSQLKDFDQSGIHEI